MVIHIPTLQTIFPMYYSTKRINSTHILYPFISRNVHGFNMNTYIDRMAKHMELQPQICTLAYIYILRIFDKHKHENVKFNHQCELKLFAVAVQISNKMWNDEPCDDLFFCKVAGIDLHEYRNLEFIFLTLIDYNCFVYGREYRHFMILFINEHVAKVKVTSS